MKLQVQWPSRIVRFLRVLCGVRKIAIAELGVGDKGAAVLGYKGKSCAVAQVWQQCTRGVLPRRKPMTNH